ncbi:MAG: GntR family transcriptional regulator, partial [Pseudonocardiaceae bacterium]|nr:GntR family transcriptional regulator [Pseudonocardiaceae bacterium]
GAYDPGGVQPGTRLPKASDMFADRLRAVILGGELEPGSPLPSEAELIEAHQLSRGTVREGLRLLEAEGLIVIKRGPKGGIYARRPDVSQVSRSLAVLFTSTGTTLGDFFAFRLLVEPEAAAEAARSATDEVRRFVVKTAQEDRGLPPSLERAPEFHRVIGMCSNNGVYR